MKNVWIRILIISLFSLMLVISTFQVHVVSEADTSKHASLESFTAHLDERIPALMKRYAIPGVNIALVQKGKTMWSQAYGYADLENGRKMTTDTYCRVESISKPVTAWGVMKLVEQGKIDLDTPVVQYLKTWEFPESEFPEEKVTLRQLLSHSAGMPLGDIFERYSPSEGMPSLEESLYSEARLIREPGSSFFYSNTGFNLIELLIEEVTGRDFDAYMAEQILDPLGMQASSFTWSENLKPAVPVGYGLKGQAIPVYVYPAKASGGLLATVGDIAAFITAGMTSHADHQVLNAQSINELYTPMIEEIGVYDLVFDSYGLGHYLEILPNGEQAVCHGGQGGGWMTHFHSVPETGDGIVILANSQRSWPFIAYILSDWAEWSGFSSVGMGQIVVGQKVLWALIALTLFISLWQFWRVGKGIITGRRRFTLLPNRFRLLRLAHISLFIVLISGLLWSVDQDYLFITAVFPIASGWLGISVLLFAVVSLLSALFPCIGGEPKGG